jgi:hypothetical protein
MALDQGNKGGAEKLLRLRQVIFVVCLAIPILVGVAWATKVAFTSSAWNIWAVEIGLLAPTVASLSGPPFRRRAYRVATRLIVWPVSAAFAFLAVLLARDAVFDITGTFADWDPARIRNIETGRYHLEVRPRGSPSPVDERSGTLLLQQCTLLPGLRVTKLLHREDSIDAMTITVINPETILAD